MQKRFTFLMLLLLLSACGFAPQYGEMARPAAQPAAALNQVALPTLADRDGQFLRNALIDRFYRGGMPSAPAYILKLTGPDINILNFDITVDAEATRRQVRANTKLSLLDKATGAILLARDLRAITSYNVLESEYATLVTERSATEAALNDLARQIETQLTLYFNRSL